MKSVLVAICLLVGAGLQAQDNSVKIGGGYAHDFPGLNGVSVFGEVSRYMSDRFKGGVGVKFSNLAGAPRTQEVQEYTKAGSIDFNIYFLPVTTEVHELRIGAGYSFSFYNIRRSYPVISNHGLETATAWPVQDRKGRVSGMSLIGEYEYFLPGTNFSAGLRASLFKAYDHVSFFGVFGGVRF
jgi:hypothetical protein